MAEPLGNKNIIDLKDLLVDDKRRSLRVDCDVPIVLGEDTPGRLVNLSKTGFCLTLTKSILNRENVVDILLGGDDTLKAKCDLVWHRGPNGTPNSYYGAQIKEISTDQVNALRTYFSHRKDLRNKFEKIVKNFKTYVAEFKNICDRADKEAKIDLPIRLTESEYNEACRNFDNYYEALWQIIELFDKDNFLTCKTLVQNELHPLIVESAEINRYIFEKPLGYAGDFHMMNYIFDYHDNNFLGTSTYERFINRYTCNIPISTSNIQRKKFFKSKILNTIKNNQDPRILSVGCGSAREWIEIISEGTIKKQVNIYLLDLDKRAVDYVISDLAKIPEDKKENFNIEFLNLNVVSLLKNKTLFEKLNGLHLVYASGLYDYLSEYIARRLVQILFNMIKDNGRLILCNASEEFMTHRAYYELLGEWKMIHRTKSEMLSITKLIKNEANITFDQSGKVKSYYFLDISRK